MTTAAEETTLYRLTADVENLKHDGDERDKKLERIEANTKELVDAFNAAKNVLVFVKFVAGIGVAVAGCFAAFKGWFHG